MIHSSSAKITRSIAKAATKYLIVNILDWQYQFVFHSSETPGVYKTEHYMSFRQFPLLSACIEKKIRPGNVNQDL